MAFLDAAWHASVTEVEVVRAYSTLRKDQIGDFGHGWRLAMLDVTVQTNGPLGRGGWTFDGCGEGTIYVPICYESAEPHLVVVKWPDGRVEAFDLTPAEGSSFFPYTASHS